MTFTAVRYPMDKEKKSSDWQDNEENLGVVANDNFFEQFVSFGDTKPTEFHFEDPPSPSLLLDSLDDSLTNSSSNDEDNNLLSGPSFTTDHFAPRDNDIDNNIDNILPRCSSANEQTNEIFRKALLSPSDPVIGTGYISDSKLLRKEGISLRSPARIATTPSSPPLMPSSSSSLSPRKPNRFVESLYNTVRRVGHGPKTHRMSSTSAMDVFRRQQQMPRQIDTHHYGHNIYPYTTDRLEPVVVKSEPSDSHGLPLSPPLTGKTSNNMGFVQASGQLEDPFGEELMSSSATTINHLHWKQNIPQNTPAMNGVAFGHNSSMKTVDSSKTTFRVPQQHNLSSAEWPMEGIMMDDAQMWSAANSFASQHSPGCWWEDSSSPANNNNINHAAIHSQQQFEYDNDNSELSGLMIHMPQPRQPQAAVLTQVNIEQLCPSTPTHHYNYHHQSHHNTECRTQPHAMSSGAGHHHGSYTSPHKPSSLHHSPSRTQQYNHREESCSPSPPSSRRHFSSMSVRKQRSWSSQRGRATEPRTPSFDSSSGGGLDFVNFTPSDKGILMTGVAPSGSSKTKARRQKEQAEKERRLSAAVTKVLQEVGGDINRLSEHGFEIV